MRAGLLVDMATTEPPRRSACFLARTQPLSLLLHLVLESRRHFRFCETAIEDGDRDGRGCDMPALECKLQSHDAARPLLMLATSACLVEGTGVALACFVPVARVWRGSRWAISAEQVSQGCFGPVQREFWREGGVVRVPGLIGLSFRRPVQAQGQSCWTLTLDMDVHGFGDQLAWFREVSGQRRAPLWILYRRKWPA